MDIKKRLLEYLQTGHVGRMNAVTSKMIEQIYGINGRHVRVIINDLRKAGYPICSDSHGYYFAASEAELRSTMKRLLRSAAETMKVVQAMKF